MDVLLNEEDSLLRDALRRFFEEECPPARVREVEDSGVALDEGLWQSLAGLGWLGLAFPATYGGSEAPLTDLLLLFEEAGRSLAPVPLHPHIVAGMTLAKFGTPAQKERLLPGAAGGSLRLTWAHSGGGVEGGASGSGNGKTVQAKREGGGWRLHGVVCFVDGYEGARSCLVPVQGDSGAEPVSLVLVEPGSEGLSATMARSLSGERQALLRLDGVRVTDEDVVSPPNEGAAAAREMVRLAVLLNTALIVGATRRAVERAVDYAKERVAFGKPIGAFQAIAHLCANMIIWVDGAELLARQAAWKWAAGRDAELEVAGAKAFANERCQAALREANQIHGGLAQVYEYDQQLWYRRAAAWSMRLGTSIEHRRTVARRLGLGGVCRP